MKIKGLRWYIIGLIAVSTLINLIDRSAINIMWPYIYRDFGITEMQSKNSLALITTFFLMAYALGQIFGGKIVDKLGSRLGMTWAIGIWSMAISLHGIARSLFSFNAFRVFLGFSEAVNWPATTKSNAEWFPVKERAMAQGIFGASSAIGSIIAGPLIAISFVNWGWRLTFIWIGILGLLWIPPWLMINKGRPGMHPNIIDAELEYIKLSEKEETQFDNNSPVYTFRQVLGFKKTWGIVLSRFFIDPVWWLFLTWLPTFLKAQFSFNIKQFAAFVWFPYCLAAIGALAGGYYSFRLVKRGIVIQYVRKKIITIGCVLMLLSLLTMGLYLKDLKENVTIVIVLIGVALFGFQFMISNIQTLPSDYYATENIGMIAGMAGCAAVIGTLITTWLVPVLTQTGFSSFFLLGSAMVPLSWLSAYFLCFKISKAKALS